MNKTTQPMFPNEEACERWLSRNCRQCDKSVRRKLNSKGITKSKCKMFGELMMRMDDPTVPVSYRACRIVLMAECPHLQRVKVDTSSMSLFNI